MKKLKCFCINILLYLFGTAFLKKVRSVIFSMKTKSVGQSDILKLSDNDLELSDDLIKYALEIKRNDFAQAIKDAMNISKKSN